VDGEGAGRVAPLIAASMMRGVADDMARSYSLAGVSTNRAPAILWLDYPTDLGDLRSI
jgi:hypothetical protein